MLSLVEHEKSFITSGPGLANFFSMKLYYSTVITFVLGA